MQGHRRTMIGQVVSDKMNKTIVVLVEARKRHPLYGKVIRITKRYKAHDEKNDCHMGDRVQIVEARPLSKEKRWVVDAVLERAK